MRVTAQLIDAAADQNLCAIKLDRDIDDIFVMQDEITLHIAAALQPEIEKAEQQRSSSKRPSTLAAWDYYQRGLAAFGLFTRDGTIAAREMFMEAMAIDSTYSLAYSGLALTRHRDVFWGYVDDHEQAVAALCESAQQAIALDTSSSDAHMVLGLAHLWSKDYDLAIAEEEQATELNPSNAFAYVQLGHALDLSGQSEKGIARIQIGLRLSPKDPRYHIFLSNLARAHLNLRRYGDAIAWARQAIHRPPHPLKYLVLASSLGHLGRSEEACVALQMCDRTQPNFVARWARRQVYRRPADNDHILDGLRKAGCPEELTKVA